jgi:hypothetical protein
MSRVRDVLGLEIDLGMKRALTRSRIAISSLERKVHVEPVAALTRCGTRLCVIHRRIVVIKLGIFLALEVGLWTAQEYGLIRHDLYRWLASLAPVILAFSWLKRIEPRFSLLRPIREGEVVWFPLSNETHPAPPPCPPDDGVFRIDADNAIKGARAEPLWRCARCKGEDPGESSCVEDVVQIVVRRAPNKRMQPTHQPLIKFAYARLSPIWRAADA